MTSPCPECGSAEIITDLLVFSDESLTGQHLPYVKLMEPEPAKRPFVWMPKSVAAGFRAAVCGACGFTRFYTRQHGQLLEAQKKGYTSQTYEVNLLPI